MKDNSNTITTIHDNRLKPLHTDSERRSTFLFGTLILFVCLPLQIEAIEYELWSKYPYPDTRTEPVNYCSKSAANLSSVCDAWTLPVYVNALDSPKTYTPFKVTAIVDFCDLKYDIEFNEWLPTSWDDHINLAGFDIKWLQKDQCKILCKKSYDMNSAVYTSVAKNLAYGLKREYYHHWFADNLPFTWCYKFNVERQYSPLKSFVEPRECMASFPIGYITDDRGLPVNEKVPMSNFSRQNAMFLYNHYDFTVYYESGEGKSWSGKLGSKVGRVTNLRINPRSINHEANGAVAFNSGVSLPVDPSVCSTKLPPLEIPYHNHNATMSIIYSYSVDFVEDGPANGGWERRWKRLESVLPGSSMAKWIYALAILLLIATSIPAAYAIARTIFADRVLIFVNPRDEGNDEAAWKSLAGDIFREPSHMNVLSVLVGGGCVHILMLLLVEIALAFVSLMHEYLFIFLLLVTYFACSFIGGYVAIRIYRTFGGERWPTVCWSVVLISPIPLVYAAQMFRQELLIQSGSDLATPIDILELIVLLVLAAIPTLVGGHIAFKMASIAFPVRPTANQRILLGPIVWRLPAVSIALLALIPMICIWSCEAYPIVGNGAYFMTASITLIVVCLNISHCYLHLSQYDYRWWWRPHLVSGLGAIYYFLYCLYYMRSNLYIDSFAEAIPHIAIDCLACFVLFLMISTVGFATTFLFLWRTYQRTDASPDMDYAMFQKDNQVE